MIDHYLVLRMNGAVTRGPAQGVLFGCTGWGSGYSYLLITIQMFMLSCPPYVGKVGFPQLPDVH